MAFTLTFDSVMRERTDTIITDSNVSSTDLVDGLDLSFLGERLGFEFRIDLK